MHLFRGHNFVITTLYYVIIDKKESLFQPTEWTFKKMTTSLKQKPSSTKQQKYQATKKDIFPTINDQ